MAVGTTMVPFDSLTHIYELELRASIDLLFKLFLSPTKNQDCSPFRPYNVTTTFTTKITENHLPSSSKTHSSVSMALLEDQQHSHYKHYCRICKRGFRCGRALGGHMRAHGIGDDSAGHLDDDEDDEHVSDWEGNVAPSTNNRLYALRTNPNRLKSCRSCENCGKEFLSWKSFLEHGKCSSSDDAESLVSSPGGSDGEDGLPQRGYGNWSKRKRSFRGKVGSILNSNCGCPSSEEEDLANCLMMLSNARVDPLEGEGEAEAEESCASASKDEERIRKEKAKAVMAKGMFECKACKKVFNSHQALGGHRASHKKVKGCFAAKMMEEQEEQEHEPDSDTDVIPSHHQHLLPAKSTTCASTSKRKPKIHECSICHRVFSSGQALGGHKRCHWITSNSPDQNYNHNHPHHPDPLDLTLDLNLPAPLTLINPSTRQLSTEIFLQPLLGVRDHSHQHNNIIKNNIKINNNHACEDDEAESKVKLAKLSELNDMKISGASSLWLQMGIGSTTQQVGGHP